MGGGAVPLYVDLHWIQLKASSSNLPSIPTSNSSSASSNNLNLPVSATFTGPLKTSSSETNCGRLESVDGREEKRASGSLYNLVFGHVPSQVEVQNAIHGLQNFMLGKSSSGSELKWLEQKLDGFDPRLLLSQGYRRFCDAFQLLYTDPTIKRLVVSLVCDKAIWDAVMKNESVRNFQWKPYTVDYGGPQSSDEEPDLAAHILRWILDATKAKVIELIEKFRSLVNELFQPPDKENPKEGNKEQMEEKVRSSLLLSVVIILIVVVARIPIA
ncbi:putative Post-SET domain-containing protein [Fagus crenata]